MLWNWVCFELMGGRAFHLDAMPIFKPFVLLCVVCFLVASAMLLKFSHSKSIQGFTSFTFAASSGNQKEKVPKDMANPALEATRPWLARQA